MCGRFVREVTPELIAGAFGAVLSLPKSVMLTTYNIAPSQPALIVRGQGGRREVAALQWGLIPHWAKEASVGHRMINARAETVATRPAYREAFRLRRCLVPATGFYEWARTGKGKQPYLVRMNEGELFAFAGLWESWQPPGGELRETFTVITTDANARLRGIHDRMPVMLSLKESEGWLDPQADPARLQSLLKPAPDESLTLHPVGRLTNSPRHDTPDCVKPIDADLNNATLWDSGG